MKWKDLENSTELAEVLGLVASLVAAVIALKDAQKEQETEEKVQSDTTDEEHEPSLDSKDGLLLGRAHEMVLKHKVSLIFAGLGVVLILQLAIILFIAYKLL